MLTWRLWRALNHPPLFSPLYRRVYQRQSEWEGFDLRRVPLFGWFRNAGMIILPIFLILVGAPGLVLLSYLALVIAPLLLPVANTVYGIALAASASGRITKEREQRTYDVLCTTPHGTLGMHWSYCMGWIHRHWTFRFALLGILAIGIVASFFGLPPQILFGAGESGFAVATVRALGFGVVFVADYAQTIIVSSLTTLLIPVYAETESNARLWGSSLFLALQLAVYLPTLLIGGIALPRAFNLLQIDPGIGDLLIPVLTVGFFLTARALIITGLWNAVEQQLATTAVELDAVAGLAV